MEFHRIVSLNFVCEKKKRYLVRLGRSFLMRRRRNTWVKKILKSWSDETTKVGWFGVVNFKLQSSLDNYTKGSLRWCTNFHQFRVECETGGKGGRGSVIKECQYERYPAIITAIANTKYRFTPRRNCFMHFINVITNRPVIIFNRFNWISHGCRVRVRSYFCGDDSSIYRIFMVKSIG